MRGERKYDRLSREIQVRVWLRGEKREDNKKTCRIIWIERWTVWGEISKKTRNELEEIENKENSLKKNF